MPTQQDPADFLRQLRATIRAHHMSIRTEQAYVEWIKRFIRFHHLRHPSLMGENEVGQFLSHLAREANGTASNQSQALESLIFLYRHMLHRDLKRVAEVMKGMNPGCVARDSRMAWNRRRRGELTTQLRLEFTTV